MKSMVLIVAVFAFQVRQGSARAANGNALDLFASDDESTVSEMVQKREALHTRENDLPAKVLEGKKPPTLDEESRSFKRNANTERMRRVDELLANLLKDDNDDDAISTARQVIEKTEAEIERELLDLAEKRRSLEKEAKRFPQTFESLFGRMSRQLKKLKDIEKKSERTQRKEELIQLGNDFGDFDLFDFEKRKEGREESDETRPPRPG